MNESKKPVVAKQLKICKSQIAGKGVFTLEDIKRGDYILTTRFRGGWKFLENLNHSCKPNARLKRGFASDFDMLFATRRIQPGTEITFDYRKTRWAHYFDDIEFETGCLCPSCLVNC